MEKNTITALLLLAFIGSCAYTMTVSESKRAEIKIECIKQHGNYKNGKCVFD